MNGLAEIITANERAVKTRKVETETSRHCSYAGDVENGIVLHSAKQRSTVYLKKGRGSRLFLAAWFGTNSAEKRDALIENYFNTRKRT